MQRLKCVSFMKFSTAAAQAEQQLQELEGQVKAYASVSQVWRRNRGSQSEARPGYCSLWY